MQISHVWFLTWGLLAVVAGAYVALQQTVSAVSIGVESMTTLKTISEKLSAWRRYRDAVRELSQLSDRELEDIGVRRGDIEFVVRRSVAAKNAA